MRLRHTFLSVSFIGALALLLGGTFVASDEEQPQELTPENRDYDQKHIRLDVEFDFPGESVSGSCHITLVPLRDDFRRILLHSEDTAVLDVQVRPGGEEGTFPARSFRIRGGLLVVDLGRSFSQGEELTLEIDYESTPTRGLHFFTPTEAHPETPTQVWSQGEARNNHHWFPCYDQPDDRITSELTAHVPLGMEVISNGRLLTTGKSKDGKRATFHFRMERSHVPYLISVIAGEFDHQIEDWDGIPLHAYVPKGMGEMVPTTFGRTGNMMSFFSDYTGQRYPYTRYSQTTVWQFTHGGMENTTATTLNLRAIHDERAHLDYSADGLIAHELAHQWFGDLITCRNWNEMWLNEGFATYFTDLFFEHQEGRQEFLIRRRGSANWVRRSTADGRKAMRAEREKEAKAKGRSMDKVPLELPRGHNYAKGASILHILRQVMGDDAFREGIRRYVSRRKDTCPTSEELREDLEAVHGGSLAHIFDEWVYGAGYPHFEVTWKWDAQEKVGKLRVKQVQDETAGLFHCTVTVAFHREGEAGLESTRREIQITQAEEEFSFPLEGEPAFVRFDEGDVIPKKLTFPKGLEGLSLQALKDPDVTGRLDAVQSLGDLKEEAVPALARVLGEDPEKAVREAAAGRLGPHPTERSLRALLQAIEDDAPRVRGAAARSLGGFAAPKVEESLLALLENDPSFAVQAAAARSLGRCKSSKARAPLRAALKRGSYRNGVEVAAAGALADMGDVSDLPEVIDLVTGMTDALGRSSVRGGALRAMVRLGKGDERIRKVLVDLLDHPSRWTRFSAARSLQEVGRLDQVPHLIARVGREEDERVKKAVSRAVEEIVKAAGTPPPPKGGEEEITRLAAEAKALESAAKRKALEAKLAELEAEKVRLEIRIRRLREELEEGGKREVR